MTRARPVTAALAALVLAFLACGDGTGTENHAELPILPDFGMDPGDDTQPDPGEMPDEGLPPDAVPDVPADPGPDADEPEPGPLFVEGCPVPGQALARRIEDPSFAIEGPDAIGRPGDFLLANDRAAFVIQAADHRNAYYLYGGIPVDAVAVRDCRQDGVDRFAELGLMMGTLVTSPFYDSILRAFSADTVEVVSDGSDGGPAVVRATGFDDTFWLVELELVGAAYASGARRPLSEPYGLEIVVEYSLAPGSSVLQVDLAFRNLDAVPKELLAGAQALVGATTRTTWYADAVMNLGGFSLQTGVPWVVSSLGDGAWAFAMPNTTLGTADIHGIQALLDLSHVIGGPMALAAAGLPGDTVRARYLLAVGPTDANSAVRHLATLNPEPIPGKPYVHREITGTVTEPLGPVANAHIDLEARNTNGSWRVLDRYVTGLDGTYAGTLPDFGTATPDYRLTVTAEGHPPVDPLPIPATLEGPFDFSLDPTGGLCWDITDTDDNRLPAKVWLMQNGSVVRRFYTTTLIQCAAVAPGDYHVVVSRGFEYQTFETDITIPAHENWTLAATLERVVDTTGWMSVDTHTHGYASPDATVTDAERVATAAAEGLEVLVATDHEAVSDWAPEVEAAYLTDWLATVVGQEVTAPIPEHTTMLGCDPRPDLGRGGNVPWYGLDIAQIYDQSRARGGRIVGLNHPRGGNYLTKIQWNRLTGAPNLTDPTRLGLGPDAALWTWDFDIVEMMNGPQDPFVSPSNPSRTGLFDDWASFLNHGHRITAVGASDVHGLERPGTPRTYFASSTDDPADFDPEDLYAALKSGRAQISTGAFATVTVNGSATLGDTVTDTDGTVDLHVRIQAMPAVEVTGFKVYVNCDQVAAIAATDPDGLVKYDDSIPLAIDADAYIVVMGFGSKTMPLGLRDVGVTVPRFATNPIFVDADGDDAWTAPGGKTCAYDRDLPGD
jgi:hypothetical protein